MSTPPEHNVTGIDYSQRSHFRYDGPLFDFHAHVMITRPTDPPAGPPVAEGPDPSSDQAEVMLDVGREFGIQHTVSMCLPDDIPMLREKLGDRISFNGQLVRWTAAETEEDAFRTLERFLELGVRMIKLWSAPRGRDRGLFVDAPWRIEGVRRAVKAGVRIVMVHVADPDAWFRTVYADSAKYGTKPDQYVGFRRMIEMFPEVRWIGAHMGGDPEHPEHLAEMLERYPNLSFDMSATKWQVREVSQRPKEVRDLVVRYADRFLWGSDLVTRHGLPREHYVSRYWCQRTLWESDWEGPSPIADPDWKPQPGEPSTPMLRGIALPREALDKIYWTNAKKLLGPGSCLDRLAD
ncbi:MAG: amidohydrolase [Gemmataceae bacterium]|nr:amidohydrolase [Gemmataceae bacterium]